MLFVDTRSEDVCYNLAAEYYFASEKEAEDGFCFMWRVTPTVVIGRYQNALEEIDAAYVREKGIAVVRRLSGGGTVYLDRGGWQFAFVTDADGEGIDFARFLDPVVDVLRSLGLDAVRTGRNDISVGGRKVCGNAQYRVGRRVVHHGCMLFSADIGEMARATTPQPYKIRSKEIASVRERVANIRDLLPPAYADLTEEGFRDILVRAVSDGQLPISPEDNARIRQIADEKFRSEQAFWAKGPKFDIEKLIETPGGAFQIGFSVEGGRIVSAGVRGDFFGDEDAAKTLADALTGTEYTPSAVRDAIGRAGIRLFLADADMLAKGMFE